VKKDDRSKGKAKEISLELPLLSSNKIHTLNVRRCVLFCACVCLFFWGGGWEQLYCCTVVLLDCKYCLIGITL